ncbi:MAG: CPBP family intramembrane metalloprotease [Bacteroidales bacterium]|jgi:membrane protease YdiL (CAAX protease family)|nr:CPBP family intramembrane metalloprotease [Bacteroidales bacterium]
MSKNIFSIKSTPAWLQIIYFFLLSAGCFIIFSVISSIILVAVGRDTDTLWTPLTLWLTQFITAVGLFIIPALWFCYVREEKLSIFFNLSKRFSYSWLWWILLWIVTIPLLSWIIKWNADISFPASFSALENWLRTMEKSAEQVTNILLSQVSFKGIVLNLLIIAILPAIAEELFFRGVILRLLSEWWGKKSATKTNNTFPISHIAVWVSAIIFSALHFQFFGFIPRMLLGVLLGYAYVCSGSLLLPILIHFTNNAIATVFYSSSNPMFNQNIDTPVPTIWVIISIVATVAVIVAIVKNRQNHPFDNSQK